MKKRRVKTTHLPQWLTPEIQQAMRLRDNFKKSKQFDDYKRQRNKVNILVRKAKRAFFEKLVSNDNKISQVWKALNVLSNKSRRNHSTSHNFTEETFNSHLVSTVQNIKYSIPNPSATECLKSRERLQVYCRNRLRASDELSIPLLSIHEVSRLILSLNSKKTLDAMHLNANILKLSLPYICESLTFLYNLCLKNHVFPRIFKEAKVIPIPKTKNAKDVDDFRPISILPVISKPLEKHIHFHLLNYLEDRNLFHKLQSGFRPNHSCNTAQIRLCNSWTKAIDEENIVGAVYLDLRKAFDMVDHDILLRKLSIYFQNENSVLLLRSYLSDRTQRTYVNGSLSSLIETYHGVPQGSILGPLLFCLYINDLPLHLRHKNVALDLFADDASLSASGKNPHTFQTALQESIDDVQEWCALNKMALNPSKSKCMIITVRQKHQLRPLCLHLQLNGQIIDQVKEHRLLGVVIDDQLNWISHIHFVQKKISNNIFLLSRLKHYVSSSALKTFFYAHVLAHVNYSSSIWSKADNVHIKKIDRLIRRSVRIMSKDQSLSTDQKFNQLGILSLANQLKYNVSILMFKQANSLAPIYIRELFPKSYNERTYCYKPPTRRLENLASKRFDVQGVKVWNSLPLICKSCATLRTFKKYTRIHLTQSV